jgi:hypothetical protein
MRKLSKKQCENLVQECIELVKKKRSNFFILKKLKGAHGICWWDHIEIDPRKEFLSTSIHECLHFLYPDWSETDIMYAESRIMNRVDYLKLMEFISLLTLKLYNKEKYRKKNRKKTK